MEVTVFTPTYNRAYILPKLYDSLKKQTCKDFIWLIVDDGSEDNTKKLVDSWIEEKKIEIKYYYQDNSGKSQAYNLAILKCDTLLISCVDSDDYLDDDAVEEIINDYKQSNNAIGLVYMRRRADGTMISKWSSKLEYATLREAYSRYGIFGDTMLVYDTKIIKKHSFPKFKGEKFVPESYLYDQLDRYGVLKFIHKAIYICEYLPDGYTHSMAKVIKSNPEGYLAYINQRLDMDRLLIDICSDTIRYCAVSISANKKKIITSARRPLITAILFPLGIAFYRLRYKNI